MLQKSGVEAIYMLKEQSIAPDFIVPKLVDLVVQTSVTGRKIRIANCCWIPLLTMPIEQAHEQLHNMMRDLVKPVLVIDEGNLRLGAVDFASLLRRHLMTVLAGINADQLHQMVIVYQPRWAAEYRLPADTQRIRIAHRQIRDVLATVYEPAIATQVAIFYGGFLFKDELSNVMNDDNVNGVVVGNGKQV